MNITDRDCLWRLKDNTIENRKTKEIKILKNPPNANTIAYMNYRAFLQNCRIAFKTGIWPK
jgi:hypothetical protein